MSDQRYVTDVVFEYETVKLMNKELVAAKDNLLQVAKGGGDVAAAMDRLNKIVAQKQGLADMTRQATMANTAMQGTTKTTANAGMALLNLNYVIRDSPYFFQNFALGVLAVGNNINPLIDSFNRLRTEAVEKNTSTFALLRKALVGGAGISIAFSVVVTAIQSVVFYMTKMKRETKDAAEAVSELSSAMQSLINLQDPIKKLETIVKPEEIDKLIERVKTDLTGRRQRAEDIIISSGFPLGLESVEIIKSTMEIRGRLTDEISDNVAIANAAADAWEREKKDGEDLIGVFEKLKGEVSANARAYDLLTQSGLTFTEKTKEKTKAVKKLNEMIGATPPLLRDIVDAMAELNKITALQELGGGRPGTGGDGLRPGGLRQTPVNPFEGTLKDIDKQLKEEFAPTLSMIASLANTAGNAISNAFLSGKDAISAAGQALAQFIIQLLVVQSLMGLLTMLFIPGGTFLSGFTSFLGKGSVHSPSGGSLNKGALIRVEGNLRAEGNEFIAGFNKSVNIYNHNVKGTSLGRNG